MARKPKNQPAANTAAKPAKQQPAKQPRAAAAGTIRVRTTHYYKDHPLGAIVELPAGEAFELMRARGAVPADGSKPPVVMLTKTAKRTAAKIDAQHAADNAAEQSAEATAAAGDQAGDDAGDIPDVDPGDLAP